MGQNHPPGGKRSFLRLLHDLNLELQQLSSKERHDLCTLFLRAFLDDCPGIMASGFKLMYNQLEQFQEALTCLKEHKGRVIHLMRKNLLKRLVSSLIAFNTGLYKSTVKPLYQFRVHLRCKDLLDLLTDMEAQVNAYQKHLSSRFPCLEVWYEDVVAFPAQEADRVGDFLGIGSLGQLQADLVKVNSNSLRDIVMNYDEVAATLQDTPFERFLDADSVGSA